LKIRKPCPKVLMMLKNLGSCKRLLYGLMLMRQLPAGSCMIATGSLSMQLDGLIPERDLPAWSNP